MARAGDVGTALVGLDTNAGARGVTGAEHDGGYSRRDFENFHPPGSQKHMELPLLLPLPGKAMREVRVLRLCHQGVQTVGSGHCVLRHLQ